VFSFPCPCGYHTVSCVIKQVYWEKPDTITLYEKIRNKYTSEILYNEYFKSDSIIVKVYLYLILWEREYDHIETVEDDIKKYYNIEILFSFDNSCLIFRRNLETIINILKTKTPPHFAGNAKCGGGFLFQLLDLFGSPNPAGFSKTGCRTTLF
jgi:hypothetical protein